MTSLSSERISAAEITSDSYKIHFPRDFRGITRVNLTLAQNLVSYIWIEGEGGDWPSGANLLAQKQHMYFFWCLCDYYVLVFLCYWESIN